MTLTQILKQGGKFYKKKDASNIGHLISIAAKEKNIKWNKVEEPVMVNDYPEEFSEEMRNIIAAYYQRKNEI